MQEFGFASDGVNCWSVTAFSADGPNPKQRFAPWDERRKRRSVGNPNPQHDNLNCSKLKAFVPFKYPKF
jgi:hypothetical protein